MEFRVVDSIVVDSITSSIVVHLHAVLVLLCILLLSPLLIPLLHAVLVLLCFGDYGLTLFRVQLQAHPPHLIDAASLLVSVLLLLLLLVVVVVVFIRMSFTIAHRLHPLCYQGIFKFMRVRVSIALQAMCLIRLLITAYDAIMAITKLVFYPIVSGDLLHMLLVGPSSLHVL
jgi:hypothetical protein